MPTPQQIETVLHNHFDAWNSGDAERWFTNFTLDVLLEDPVGGPRKIGRQGLESSWEKSFCPGHHWRLEPLLLQICQDQAALHVRNHGAMNDRTLTVDSIEIYTVADDGRISHVRTYFNPPPGETLDPYFMQVDRP